MDKTTKAILALEALCAILLVAVEIPEAAAAADRLHVNMREIKIIHRF